MEMNIATLPTTNALVQNKCYLKKCDSKSTYPEKKGQALHSTWKHFANF